MSKIRGPHPYWIPLVNAFRSEGDPTIAVAQKAYMKDLFPFHGVKMPVRRQLVRDFLTEHGHPSSGELEAIVRNAWDQPEREMQYTAMELLAKAANKAGPELIPLAEDMVLSKSWWDTVDFIAPHIIGSILKRHPKDIAHWNKRWMSNGELWAQRTALLFQMKWGSDTDEALLLANCAKLSMHKDFFIRKAIGWALREYAKSEPEAVHRFVGTQAFSPLTVREALKHL